MSVDAKKKELVGDFKNPGREWQPQGEAEEEEMATLSIRPDTFHGEWNYTILPRAREPLQLTTLFLDDS